MERYDVTSLYAIVKLCAAFISLPPMNYSCFMNTFERR
jgi:hypothetical protein